MRTRSAKKLAQRIDLYYFRRPGGLRRWRTRLSIALPLAALLWLGGMAAAGNRRPYSSGPVARPHAVLESRCEVCHTADAGLRAHVAPAACLSCHDAPAHRGSLMPAPSCASCHREHSGREGLAMVADRECASCHADLPAEAAATRRARAGDGGSAPVSAHPIERRVAAFPASHPEFAVSRAGARDPGTIRFNHAVHLKADLRGPSGRETLECAGCHAPAPRRASAPPDRLMAPVNYESQCARCHPLFFDERLDVQAPHEEPAVVRSFVGQALRAYIERNPGALNTPDPPPRRVPLNFPRVEEPPARTPAEWVARRSARAEALLWERTCRYCHEGGASAGTAPGALPVIRPAGLGTRWMPGAEFDHAPHMMVECASCHRAGESTATPDVLMPKAATCAACHAPGKGAGASCATCHAYHDWSRARPVKGRLKVADFQ